MALLLKCIEQKVRIYISARYNYEEILRKELTNLLVPYLLHKVQTSMRMVWYP